MSLAASESRIEKIAHTFEYFAYHEFNLVSPLYEKFSLGIVNDPELLELATYVRPGQPVPNLFLGASHYLLLKGVAHPLAKFYPDLTPDPEQNEDPYPYFHSFYLEHYATIKELLEMRLVQTNEVRRCALLLPAFGLASADAPTRPLAMLEIGPSAGLNLLWDSYGYSYNDGQKYGESHAPLQLTCEVKGEVPPPIPAALPPINFRLGLDLNPIDVRDDDATLWLQALIWPGQTYRTALLEQALAVARQNPPLLLKGNALDLLPAVLESVPLDATLCLFHSHTLNQFEAQARAQLSQILVQHSAQRNLYRVALEYKGQDNVLSLFSYKQGVESGRDLAHSIGHANWIRWIAS